MNTSNISISLTNYECNLRPSQNKLCQPLPRLLWCSIFKMYKLNLLRPYVTGVTYGPNKISCAIYCNTCFDPVFSKCTSLICSGHMLQVQLMGLARYIMPSIAMHALIQRLQNVLVYFAHAISCRCNLQPLKSKLHLPLPRMLWCIVFKMY